MTHELDSNTARNPGDTSTAQALPTATAISGQRPLPPDAIAIVCMRNLVLFPGMILPAGVGRERSGAGG
jgi:ATP-dependent Lon protease